MPYPFRCVLLMILVLAAPALSFGASQDFHFVKQSVTVDSVQKTATFSVTFNQPPDFAAVNGVQAESFQYEVDAKSEDIKTPIAFTDIDAVIRGAEIFEGNGIPVRDREGNGGANAGGWGPVRATLPFQLKDSTLTFTANWSDLGDQDGKFRYRLFTTDTGAITADTEASTAAIPLPGGVWTGMVTLGVLAIGAMVQRRMM